MRTTFLREAAGIQKRSSTTELWRAFELRPQDAIITALLQKRETEFTWDSCVQGLTALSKGSTRGKAIAFTPGFRNKESWANLVERIYSRLLSVSESAPPVAARKQFIPICSAVTILRLGNMTQLNKLSRDTDSAMHLLRFAAEINESLEGLDLNQLLGAVSEGLKNSPLWASTHVCFSMVMLYKNSPKQLQGKHERETVSICQRRLEASCESLSSRDLDDLAEVSSFLSKVGFSLPTTVEERIPKRNSTHFNANNTPPRVSKFEDEVLGILKRHFSHEQVSVTTQSPEGVDLCLHLSERKVAVQCYGPTHYVWDGSRIEGRTSFREYLHVHQHGYSKVLGINHSEWERMKINEKFAILRKCFV